MASNYPQPPPSYQSVGPNSKPGRVVDEEAAQPLLSPRPGPSAGGFYDQPEAGDIPDDFKYGTSVSDSAPEIRAAFVRKVYTILFMQILGTCIVAGLLSRSETAIFWITQHIWALYVPLFGTFVTLGFLYWKRHSHPLNLFLLTLFTLLEAFALGVTCAFVQSDVLLQALLITLGVFGGLTLFTFQSKYDFSGMGPWLFGGLVALLMTGIVGAFFPFGKTTDLFIAAGGTLLFSGYIVYDTYMINNRLSPDEYIMAAISLYLDFINLFLNIVRLLNGSRE